VTDTIIRVCAGIINVAAVIAVAGTALMDFYNATGRKDAVETKKTPVSAVTIVIFIAAYCVVLLFKVGAVRFNTACMVAGALICAFGATFQIIGRVQLGRSWSNQIKIYEHHRLVTTGIYSVIRHPLYATFIIMFLGNALMYSNWLAGVLTAVVFVPMMEFRARQEEKILTETFDGYADYMKTTGRLFVKLWGPRSATVPVRVQSGVDKGIDTIDPAGRQSPFTEVKFWIFYLITVGVWALGLLLPGNLALIPLISVTPYLICGVVLWLLFRNRDKSTMFGVLLGTLTPFMGMFAVISIGELLELPW